MIKSGLPRDYTIADASPLYFLPNDNLAEEVLVPGFRDASTARCMIGFFSSSVLVELAPGIASYIQHSRNSLSLIVSPYISESDQKAMQEGLRRPEEIAEELLLKGFVSESDLERHTLKCLSYLIATGRIEFQVALMKNALFHPKVWLFEAPKGRVAVHGSSNMTGPAIRKNYEQIVVSKAWEDPNQRLIVERLWDQFDRLWKHHDQDCVVVPLPEAVKKSILREFPKSEAPTEDEFRDLFKKAKGETEAPANLETESAATRTSFQIPPTLRYEEGEFAHQGRAVAAWVGAGFRGTLEMATGSGKTLTSLICAHRYYENNQPLLIVIAAPYKPLIQQWCDEIPVFGIRPINISEAGGPIERGNILRSLRRRLRMGLSKVECMVVSQDTLCDEDFQAAIGSFECKRMLIADEAHNLGRPSFINNPPAYYEARLALSATPVRQYDPEGTDKIFEFFGPVVFQFTLKEAIGRCLVHYDYFLHRIPLTNTEMDEWLEITQKIKANSWRRGKSGELDDLLQKLYRDRRALLETAQNKIGVLSGLLDKENLRTLRHTLIYCTDKAPEQLREVNDMLRSKSVSFHQLTEAETSDRRQTAAIIQAFQQGDIQVLTAKRVLDEGVNIPQISKAFILASTTVERQWIQRRGRLLRTCREIGKEFSTIHDFLALPPVLDDTLDEDARGLIRGELTRAFEFASLARNAGMPDGALPVVNSILKSAFM